MKRIITITIVIFMSSFILNKISAKDNNSYLKIPIKSSGIDTLKLDSLKIDTISNNTKIVKREIKNHHYATWYHTKGTRVHRKHPTAAYNYVPRGTKLLITNVSTGDTCLVEVTDRMGTKKRNVIDLSHMAFGILSKHSAGVIKVKIEIYEENN